MSMPNKSASQAASAVEIIGSYPLRSESGVVLSISRGSSRDYAGMRAMQLSALLKLTTGDTGDEFRRLNSEIQDNVMWLACDLAAELTELIEVVVADVRAGGAA